VGTDDNTAGGLMNGPIPISREVPMQMPSDMEAVIRAQMEADDKRHTRRMQGFFFGFVGLVFLGLLTPLVIWLSRLALGG
jgi:hypothetical protein